MAAAKVYIIDEVHMLSKGAFNALLKTLEEPPPYAYFILATTELQKIPATIQSRCQRFSFRHIREEDIIRRLQFIAVTSPQRAQVLPAVPTIAESGVPKYEALGWYILMVRAGTAAPVLARIHAGIVGALKDAAVRERLIKDGAEVVGNKPDEAARFLQAEIARWGAVVKSAGLKAE